MARFTVNLPVRLTQDIPELGLRSGDEGIVCSMWMATTAYEVEFRHAGQPQATRTLLLEGQFEPEAEPHADAEPVSTVVKTALR